VVLLTGRVGTGRRARGVCGEGDRVDRSVSFDFVSEEFEDGTRFWEAVGIGKSEGGLEVREGGRED